MKTAVIIHGMPEKEDYEKNPEQSKAHWIPWLKEKLEEQKIVVFTPEMPTPYAPVYEQWKDTFERINITGETVLVGHSGGAGFLLRWLTENIIKISKLILVAPWIDPDHIDREHMTDFFEFDLNGDIQNKVESIAIFISEDDDVPMLRTVEEIEKRIPKIKIIRKKDMGHFTVGDGVSEFPELLSEIL